MQSYWPFDAALQANAPEILPQTVIAAETIPVEAVEGQPSVRRRTASGFLAVFSRILSNTSMGVPCGFIDGLQHQRRNCAHQNYLGDPSRAVTTDIMRDLPAAGGMANQDQV